MAKKKVAEVREPAVKRLIDKFHDGHVARHGCPPMRPEWGRVAKELTAMLAAATEDEIGQLMDDFFTTTDPKVACGDYRPMEFIFNAQRLRLRRQGTTQSDVRTGQNIDAAARAMGRR